MSFTDASYIRPMGKVVLQPKVSQSWFGYGSKEEVELFDCATKTAPWAQTSYSRGKDPSTGLPLPDCFWSKDHYVNLLGVSDNLDTRKAEWGISPMWQNTVSATAWEEQRTSYPPVRYRLLQTDTTAGKYFSRRSTFQHGTNSTFAIHIDVPAPPSDQDMSLGMPFAAVAWGSWKWALIFYPDGEPILCEWYKTGWIPRLKCHSLPKTPREEFTGEAVVIVHRTRGAICITSYYQVDLPWPESDAEAFAGQMVAREGRVKDDNESIYWREDTPFWDTGHFDFFGFSAAASLGISTVSYPSNGTYFSPRPPLLQPRGTFLGTDVPLFFPDWDPNGGVCVVAHVNGASDYWFGYRVDMQPHRQTLGGKIWQRSPSLHGMGIFYPALPVPGFYSYGDGGATLEGRIESCEVEKPEQLDERTFTADMLFPDGFRLLSGDWRETPAKVFLGRDGGPELGWVITNVHSGYITKMSAKREQANLVRVRMTITGASLRPRRMRFGHTTMPRGGMTLNEILDLWLLGRGIPLTQRNWHVNGSLIRLYKGFAENPPFLPDPEGDSWDWHQKLCEIHGLELAEDDAGAFWTVPTEGYYLSTKFWHASIPIYPETAPRNIESEGDVLETYTRLFVYAKTRKGEEIARWAINWAAEQWPAYPGFRPWKEEKKIRLDFGPVDAGFVNLAVVNRTPEFLLPKVYGSWEGEFDPFLSRGQLVRIFSDGMELQGWHKILGLRHVIPPGPDFDARTHLRTERRLV